MSCRINGGGLTFVAAAVLDLSYPTSRPSSSDFKQQWWFTPAEFKYAPSNKLFIDNKSIWTDLWWVYWIEIQNSNLFYIKYLVEYVRLSRNYIRRVFASNAKIIISFLILFPYDLNVTVIIKVKNSKALLHIRTRYYCSFAKSQQIHIWIFSKVYSQWQMKTTRRLRMYVHTSTKLIAILWPIRCKFWEGNVSTEIDVASNIE